MRRNRASVLAALALLPLAEVAAASIPPRRSGDTVLYDQAELLDAGDREAVEAAQARAFGAHGVPITVVTIERATAVVAGADVDTLARLWLEAWGPEQAGATRGILLLVSQGDRRARIELGREWGGRFDREAEWILNDVMLPSFRGGDTTQGIRAGVDALADLAARGPRGQPAAGNADIARTVLETGRFPARIAAPLFILGIILGVLSLFLPQHRKVLLIASLACIAAAVFTLILFVVLGMAGRRRGGSSGGFGGGGGASGSW